MSTLAHVFEAAGLTTIVLASMRAVAEKMAGLSVIVIRTAGATGQLYGSVTSRDIAEAMVDDGAHVDRRQVELDRPIKTLGLHEVRVRLHAEVAVTVTANVARSTDEAEAQARGENVLEVEDEYEIEATFGDETPDLDDLLEDTAAAAAAEDGEAEKAEA